MQCKHVKKDGSQCNGLAKTGEELCATHFKQMQKEQEVKTDEVIVSKEKNEVKKQEPKGDKIDQLVDLIKDVAQGQKDLNSRISKLENGEGDFKAMETPPDVENYNKGVSPAFLKVVYDILGKDIKVKFQQETSQIHLIIPERLSLIKSEEVPVVGEDGKYKRGVDGRMMMEKVKRKDVRSYVVRDTNDVVKWCNKVKENILRTYSESGLPTPTFNVN